jgi:hypothetical protein
VYDTTFEGLMMACLFNTQKGKTMDQHVSRENWLLEAIDIMRPWFEEHGAKVPEKVRVSVGFGKRQRKGTIGVCYASHAAEDGIHQVYVSPVLVDPVQILGVVMHELVHAWDDCKSGHKGEFRRVATALGLTGKMTSTVPGDELKLRLQDVSGKLGDYPHSKLNVDSIPKQSTRMLKALCKGCGYTIRLTRKWAEMGLPICPCGDEMEME